MNFNIIDKQNWQRKDYFDHYFSNVPCTYSMTANLNITRFLCVIKQYSIKLYPVMIYGISYVVNAHEEFRMSIDDHGNIGVFNAVNPSYTVFHKDNKTFSSIWTEYNCDFNVFYQSYLDDMTQFGDIEKLIAKPVTANNLINISCIPWTCFSSFNLNLQKGYDYLLPIFTIGKFTIKNGITQLPLSIQVHHAVCDGYHIACFINELQVWFRYFYIIN